MNTERFLTRHRIARLATVSPDGKPHIVPVVYVYKGKHIWIVLDRKRKRVPVMDLARVRNIRANPRVALLVDRYSEDWTKLAWARADGRAKILRRGRAHDEAIRLLRAKYKQYRRMAIENQPVIEIAVERVVEWEAKRK